MPFSFRAFWITTSSCKMRIQNTKEATVATNQSSSLIQKDKRRLCQKAMCLGLWYNYDVDWHDNKHQTKTLDTLLQQLVTYNICPRSGACSQHFHCIFEAMSLSPASSWRFPVEIHTTISFWNWPPESAPFTCWAQRYIWNSNRICFCCHETSSCSSMPSSKSSGNLTFSNPSTMCFSNCCCVSAHPYIPISFPNRLEFSLNPWYQPQPVVQ